MKNIVYLFLIIGLATSCKNSNDAAVNTAVQTESFSFTCPKDWNVTEQEELEEGTLYLSVEKNGFDSSGLMTITSFDQLLDLDEMIVLNLEELHNNSFLSGLATGVIKDDTFNNMPSRSSEFSFSAMGLRHEGIVVAFAKGNRSFVILKQEALEDAQSNKKGFETIENSFKAL